MYNCDYPGVVSAVVEQPDGHIETGNLIEKETNGGSLRREATLKSPGVIDEENQCSVISGQ